MGITEKLKKQMESPDKEIANYAKECLTIVNALKDLRGGKVWEREFQTLVDTRPIKDENGHISFFNAPSAIGEIFLKGLSSQKE